MSISRLFYLLLFTLSLCIDAFAKESHNDYSTARQRLVKVIEQDVRDTSNYLDKKQLDTRVMAVLAQVPRHQFVPDDVRSRAYENRPLPIGYGQTISQPYIVAIMTDLIAPKAEHKALEIGTGSGYQAAVLSRLVDQVYTMEIVEPLGKQATERLKQLGYSNIEVSIADGYYGWETHAPFDIIIVTAAASHIPPPLIEQLKPGGKMIIPVGSRFMTQQLLLVDKDEEKEITIRQILPVRFVPLTGDHK
jgi:protein-L-isoaspartate(D-aspartate) O-methyltransferase